MKVRQDFVTNSSSSSFIVAVKDVSSLPEFESLPRWASKMIASYMRMITRDGTVIQTKEELKKHFEDDYGPGEIEADGWCKERYDAGLRAIKKGYSVLMIEVDYNDETGSDFLQSLPETDKGGGIYKLYSSD